MWALKRRRTVWALRHRYVLQSQTMDGRLTKKRCGVWVVTVHQDEGNGQSPIVEGGNKASYKTGKEYQSMDEGYKMMLLWLRSGQRRHRRGIMGARRNTPYRRSEKHKTEEKQKNHDTFKIAKINTGQKIRASNHQPAGERSGTKEYGKKQKTRRVIYRRKSSGVYERDRACVVCGKQGIPTRIIYRVRSVG